MPSYNDDGDDDHLQIYMPNEPMPLNGAYTLLRLQAVSPDAAGALHSMLIWVLGGCFVCTPVHALTSGMA